MTAMPAAHPLLHPVSLAAIVLLVVNDHVFKAAWPGVLTGKLSDVAGLAFFPLLLAAVAQQVRPALRLRPTVAVCAGLTALVFASIQVWPLAGDAYRVGLGALQWPFRALWSALAGHGLPRLAPVALTPDASDLLTLPAVLLAVWLAAAVSSTRPDKRLSERPAGCLSAQS
jgi:hypothetical protein